MQKAAREHYRLRNFPVQRRYRFDRAGRRHGSDGNGKLVVTSALRLARYHRPQDKVERSPSAIRFRLRHPSGRASFAINKRAAFRAVGHDHGSRRAFRKLTIFANYYASNRHH